MLIYLDLETTGLEEADRICSIGLIVDDGKHLSVSTSLVKPVRKVRPEAMAVHHITNEMLQTAPPFEATEALKILEAHNDTESVLVAHNIDFDLKMLYKEGFTWKGGIIDTLRCSKHLVEEIERFSLQYLRYELGLYRDETEAAKTMGITLQAHSALSDAFHVRELHRYLNEMADDEKLMALTTEPALIKKLSFGKYKGHYLEEVAMSDAGYLRWLLEQETDDDLKYSIKHYL